MEFRARDNSFSLQSIMLEEYEGFTSNILDIVLLGKILAKRSFRRFIVKEIVTTN